MPKAKIEEQLNEMPEITKNEVIQENNFFKAIKKYEKDEPFNPWPIIVIIVSIIVALSLIL